MSRAIALLLLASVNVGLVYGMDCSLGHSSNYLEKVLNSCPQPFQSDEKSYCCYSTKDGASHCCNFEEFVAQAWLGIGVPIIITVGVAISLIACCISCLCCSCCPWYRRRHRGTVYGKVHVPNVHVIQTPVTVPAAPHNVYTTLPAVGPTNSTGMPQVPPQYSNELYAKQAPYNPNYPQ